MARTLPPMAATNKCLAQNNKSRAGDNVTDKASERRTARAAGDIDGEAQ
jgi:hypothetical protein